MATEPHKQFSIRELAILRLISLGWSKIEIARAVGCCETNVSNYRVRMCKKFGCHPRQLPFMGFVVGAVDLDVDDVRNDLRQRSEVKGAKTFFGRYSTSETGEIASITRLFHKAKAKRKEWRVAGVNEQAERNK